MLRDVGVFLGTLARRDLARRCRDGLGHDNDSWAVRKRDLTEVTSSVIAVDPAYTSKWGAEHWQRPTSSTTHKTTRHEAASLVIGRRALAPPGPATDATAPPAPDGCRRASQRPGQTGRPRA